MDTTAILSRKQGTNPISEVLEWLQQIAANLAAIREMLEIEHAFRMAERRKARAWPPASVAPLSHLG
ncbi:MAG: hypothetical protein WBZ01_06925 [Terriglobales bacterium]|jgi:hypothetical protein